MYIKQNLHNHKALISTKISSILIIGTISLTGCDKMSNISSIFERKTDTDNTYKVIVPKTAPLEAGSSVTDSLLKNNQTGVNDINSNQDSIILEPSEKYKSSHSENKPTSKSEDEPKTQAQDTTKKTQQKLSHSSKKPSIILGKIIPGTPAATIQKALDALYYGSAEEAASYYHVNQKDFGKTLAKMQRPFQENTKSVKIVNTKYSGDKSTAIVEVLFSTKDTNQTESVPYQLKKQKGKWIIWAE